MFYIKLSFETSFLYYYIVLFHKIYVQNKIVVMFNYLVLLITVYILC